MTGFAMSSHVQGLEFSTMIHKVFGYTLMGAALARVVEICFILQDGAVPDSATSATKSFQHLPPFLLVLAGLTLLSATEEQIAWIAGSGMDWATYTNVLISTSFVIYLTAAGILELYEQRSKRNEFTPGKDDLERGEARDWYGIPLLSFLAGRVRGLRGRRAYETIPLREGVDSHCDFEHDSPKSPDSSVSSGSRLHKMEASVVSTLDVDDDHQYSKADDPYWAKAKVVKEY